MPPWHRVWVTPRARQWKLCIFNAVSLMMNGERERKRSKTTKEEHQERLKQGGIKFRNSRRESVCHVVTKKPKTNPVLLLISLYKSSKVNFINKTTITLVK